MKSTVFAFASAAMFAVLPLCAAEVTEGEAREAARVVPVVLGRRARPSPAGRSCRRR